MSIKKAKLFLMSVLVLLGHPDLTALPILK